MKYYSRTQMATIYILFPYALSIYPILLLVLNFCQLRPCTLFFTLSHPALPYFLLLPPIALFLALLKNETTVNRKQSARRILPNMGSLVMFLYTTLLKYAVRWGLRLRGASELSRGASYLCSTQKKLKIDFNLSKSSLNYSSSFQARAQ